MPENKFEWSDDLVKDFSSHAMKSFENPNIYNDGKWEGLHTELDKWKRKKSKEKDIPKDWEIVSFISCYEGINEVIFQGNNSGVFHPTQGFRKTYTLSYLLSQPTAKIHSVKRLSDGEVFTVGDEIKWNWLASMVNSLVIKSFYLDEQNKICVTFTDERAAYQCLSTFPSNMEFKKVTPKPKVPLFTCFDGQPNFEGDYVYPVKTADFSVDTPFTTLSDQKDLSTKNTYWHYFSSEEKRNDWLLLNKPIEVCLGAIQKVIDDNWSALDNGRTTMKGITIAISDFFKSKINL